MGLENDRTETSVFNPFFMARITRWNLLTPMIGKEGSKDFDANITHPISVHDKRLQDFLMLVFENGKATNFLSWLFETSISERAGSLAWVSPIFQP